MGDVSPVLQGFRVLCGWAAALKKSHETVMAESGKEQLTVVVLCFFSHVSAKEGDTGCQRLGLHMCIQYI